MITISTTSPGETREMTDRLQTAPAWLDWRVYEMGTLAASSADGRTWTEPGKAEKR